MLDLSLHILDLMENALRAGATLVEVRVAEDPERDLLTVAIEDNGTGLAVPPEVATDPFHTTKDGKRTGLGLSLMRHAAEMAGGTLALRTSALGGLAVEASMQRSHLDRPPLGDLAATVASAVMSNPAVDVRVVLQSGERKTVVCSAEARTEGGAAWAVARRVGEQVKARMEELEMHL